MGARVRVWWITRLSVKVEQTFSELLDAMLAGDANSRLIHGLWRASKPQINRCFESRWPISMSIFALSAWNLECGRRTDVAA